MEQQKMALTNDEALELLAYLVASAQNCLSESPDYGVFRLISGAERLAQAWQPRCSNETAAFLEELIVRTGPVGAAREIDPEGFAAFLAEISRKTAREIKRQASKEVQHGT